MRRTRAPFRLAIVFAVILTVIASLTRAEETVPPSPVTGGAVVADLLIARPLGLVATVLGIGICVVTLPFTLINGSTELAAQKLIGEPAAYTFTRPLGKGI